MAVRRVASSLAAREVGLEESQDMSKILILDHHKPKMKELYRNAKSFKTRLIWFSVLLGQKQNHFPLQIRRFMSFKSL